MTYKKSQIRKRVIGNTGTRAPTDKELKRKHMITSDKTTYRGLNPDAPLVLAEGGKRYSLKVKRRVNVDGKTVDYWAADTLQEAFTNWCKNAGLGGELSSHIVDVKH